MLVRQKRLYLLVFEKLSHELLEHTGPRSDRPATDRRTNGITNCNRAAPSAGARTGSNGTPARGARLAVARVGSMAGLHANRASRMSGSVPPAPRGQVPAPCARDGLRECAAPAGYKRTFRLDRKSVRASQIRRRISGKSESTPLRFGEVFQQTARPFITHRKCWFLRWS